MSNKLNADLVPCQIPLPYVSAGGVDDFMTLAHQLPQNLPMKAVTYAMSSLDGKLRGTPTEPPAEIPEVDDEAGIKHTLELSHIH